jgi:hypothetical protein
MSELAVGQRVKYDLGDDPAEWATVQQVGDSPFPGFNVRLLFDDGEEVWGRTWQILPADFVEPMSDVAAAIGELAALKARRCDTCTWYEPWSDDLGRCASPTYTAAVMTTPPDHACNAWQPKTAQP